MTRQYGTKAWAKWAKDDLEFVLTLLEEPNKQWDEKTTRLDTARKIIYIIGIELEEVITIHR